MKKKPVPARKKISGGNSGTALVPQKHGGALLTGGVPGHKGGTGRPPNWLKDKCDDLIADPKCWEQVVEILKDKDHPAFSTMWRTVTDRAHGKATESINVSGKVTLEQLVARTAE